MDIVDRMFELVDIKYKEQKDFAVDIQVSPTRVSEWRKRKSNSYQRRLPQIAAVLGTTVGYLLTGEREKESQTATPEGNGLVDEFAKLFVRLTPEKQNEIIAEMLKRQQPDK